MHFKGEFLSDRETSAEDLVELIRRSPEYVDAVKKDAHIGRLIGETPHRYGVDDITESRRDRVLKQGEPNKETGLLTPGCLHTFDSCSIEAFGDGLGVI